METHTVKKYRKELFHESMEGGSFHRNKIEPPTVETYFLEMRVQPNLFTKSVY